MGASRIEARPFASPPAESADGVVCFAGVDWWYHNRGHSECQIMRRLARRVPVLWVNSIGMRLPTPGKTEMMWTRYARKLRSTLKGLRRDECGLWVYSPIFIPRFTRRAVEANGRLLDLQVAALLRYLGVRRPSAFVTVPTACAAVEQRSYGKVVFNRSDAFSEFPEVDSALIGGLEDRLLARADDVIYVNEKLFAREHDRVRRAHFVDHGVDFEHFAAVRSADGPVHPAPAPIAQLPRPLIGFYGALDGYTVDLELMIRIAREHPRATLLVIGPQAMDIEPLLKEPNVCYLGPVSYDLLPSYAAHFDVGIMPWLRNDWIAACNPIKLKEYLASGRPIITTDFPALDGWRDLVHVADTSAEFAGAIRKALAQPIDHAAVLARLAGETWAVKADALMAAIGDLGVAFARAGDTCLERQRAG